MYTTFGIHAAPTLKRIFQSRSANARQNVVTAVRIQTRNTAMELHTPAVMLTQTSSIQMPTSVRPFLTPLSYISRNTQISAGITRLPATALPCHVRVRKKVSLV